MDQKNIAISILAITTLFLWVSLNTAKKDTIKWQDNYSQATEATSRYKEALNEANQNIKEANSQISYAKEYEDTNYEDMSDTLTNLSEIDTIPEP